MFHKIQYLNPKTTWLNNWWRNESINSQTIKGHSLSVSASTILWISDRWGHRLTKDESITLKKKEARAYITRLTCNPTNIALLYVTLNQILLPQNGKCPLLQFMRYIPVRLQESRGFLFLCWPKNLPLISMNKKQRNYTLAGN